MKLSFDDGVEGVCDLSHLVGRGVFSAWTNDEFFRSVKIGDHGELVWPDGIDLCPDALYLKITRLPPENIFPSLKKELAHA